jgi:hypothetical protein
MLVAFRRTRLLALLAAILFHVGTALLLFIRFDSLAVLLISLLDLERRVTARLSLRELVGGARQATRWLGALLVLGALATGLSGETQLYPFACYPTFAAEAPPSMPSARVVLTRAGGACALPRPSDSPAWIAAFRISGAYGDALTVPRAHAYVRRVVREQARNPRCQLTPDTQASLVIERLAWDFTAQRTQVLKAKVVYTASASALSGVSAQGGDAASAPAR